MWTFSLFFWFIFTPYVCCTCTYGDLCPHPGSSGSHCVFKNRKVNKSEDAKYMPTGIYLIDYDPKKMVLVNIVKIYKSCVHLHALLLGKTEESISSSDFKHFFSEVQYMIEVSYMAGQTHSWPITLDVTLLSFLFHTYFSWLGKKRNIIQVCRINLNGRLHLYFPI